MRSCSSKYKSTHDLKKVKHPKLSFIQVFDEAALCYSANVPSVYLFFPYVCERVQFTSIKPYVLLIPDFNSGIYLRSDGL